MRGTPPETSGLDIADRDLIARRIAILDDPGLMIKAPT